MIDVQNLIVEIGADTLEPIAGDVSSRQYFRGMRDDKPIIVMCYPDASAVHRAELQRFIDVDNLLAQNGIRVPACYEVRSEKAYAVFEDLGHVPFSQCVKDNPNDMDQFYVLATDVLRGLSIIDADDALPPYTQSPMHVKRDFVMKYTYPIVHGKLMPKDVLDKFNAVWDEIERRLPPCPQGFVHGDYHLENLIYTEDGQCALIDFQDASMGPLPYDLVNLLEDARKTVSDDIKTKMIDRYCEGMSVADKDIFLQWYSVLSVQFHGRVIGLFIMLAAEQGRDGYLVHLSRLVNYMHINLKQPILEPLKIFFVDQGLDFDALKDLDGEEIRTIYSKL